MIKSDKNNFCKEENFNSFFYKNSTPLFNYLFYKCGDKELSQDIAQDAFIKFWNNCKKVILGKEKSFLYTIANNLFINSYTKSKVDLKFKISITEKSSIETPEFLLEEKEYNDKLQKAISNLTEAQREAFLMNRIEGKKYAEIAETLEISVKAVEKRIHKALISLRGDIKNFNR